MTTTRSRTYRFKVVHIDNDRRLVNSDTLRDTFQIYSTLIRAKDAAEAKRFVLARTFRPTFILSATRFPENLGSVPGWRHGVLTPYQVKVVKEALAIAPTVSRPAVSPIAAALTDTKMAALAIGGFTVGYTSMPVTTLATPSTSSDHDEVIVNDLCDDVLSKLSAQPEVEVLHAPKASEAEAILPPEPVSLTTGMVTEPASPITGLVPDLSEPMDVCHCAERMAPTIDLPTDRHKARGMALIIIATIAALAASYVMAVKFWPL